MVFSYFDFETVKTILTISIFVLMSFSLLTMIRYGKVNRWTYVMIPLILFLSMSVKTNIENMLGYPTNFNSKQEQVYITHLVGHEQKWIYIWAVDMSRSMEPRSYKIEYTKEREKKLSEAKQRQGQGLPQKMMLPEDSGNEFTEKTLKLWDFNKMEHITKDRNYEDNDSSVGF